MIGIIKIDEKDISDDGHIILEFSVRPVRKGEIQTAMRVKTNLKLIEWVGVSGRGVVGE